MRKRHGALGILIAALVFTAACAGKPAPPAATELLILVTNDDGIEAPGIRAVAEALGRLGRVTVAAPSRSASPRSR